MAGPWEKYAQSDSGQTQEPTGPWAKYATTPADPVNQPLEGGFSNRADREAVPTRDQTKEAYKEQYRGVLSRAGQPTESGMTIANALGRVNPFSEDIKAAVNYYGRGQGDSYQSALDVERAKSEVLTERNPVTSIGSQVVGSVALPTFGVAANTIKGGATLGAGYGATYGLGAGDDVGDRLQKAAGGALAGGAIGGALPPVIGAAASGIRSLRNSAAPIVGAVNPEQEALRRIGTALERDTKTGTAGLSAVEAEAARAAGSPVIAADLGGETTRALARSAANTSPEGRAALGNAIQSRFEGQGDRMTSLVGSLSPLGADATKTVDALQSAARAANKPAYARAYAEGAAGVWDEGLAGLSQAPAIQSAIKDATKTGANRAVADGFRPVTNPFTVAENGAVSLTKNADGSIATPSLQFWDHVKRNLDDMVETARRSGNMNQARDIGDLKSALLAKLDQAAPSYARARKGAAQFFGAEDALDAGRKFVTAGGQNSEYAKAISKFNAPERELFREGFASEMRAKLAEVSDRRAVINHSFFTSPASRQRIEMAIGRDGATKLEAQLHVERIMDAARTAMGNSTTARQLAEMGLAGGAGGIAAWSQDGNMASMGAASVAASLAAGLFRAGRGKIDQRVSQKVAELLASGDPKVVERAINMIAKSPSMLNAIRSVDEAAIKSASQNIPAGAAGFVSGMNPSRADSEKPDKR